MMEADAESLFADIVLEGGRKARACLASDECRRQNVRYLSRVDLVDHLWKVHQAKVDVPKRKTGRPVGARSEKSSNPQSEKQSRARFMDPEYKFKRNLKTQESREARRATRLWETLDDTERLRVGSKESYIKNAVAKAMESYIRDRDDRMTLIQKRISEGYKKHKRTPLKEPVPCDVYVDSPDRDVGASMPKNLSNMDVQGSLLESTKQGNTRAYIDGSLIKISIDTKIKENVKSPKVSWSHNGRSPNFVSDSPLPSSSLPFTLLIENASVRIEFGPGTSCEPKLLLEGSQRHDSNIQT